MKNIKKLSLNKETIVNLNEEHMAQLKGGNAVVRFLGTYVAGRALDYTEVILKDNTWWVGCSTDPAKQTY